jgi:hypothetical protein
VKCRSCSAEIADKAIVCYKCGTPTALPAAAPPPFAPPAPGAAAWLPVVLFVAALAGAWLAYRAESATVRWIWAAGAVGLGVLAAVGAWRGRRRPRPGVRVH